MTWTTWVGRVGALPEVLVGPILRRVDINSVSVFVATRSALNVTLRVFDSGGNQVLIGTREHLRLADSLCVTLVTARAEASVLAPGQVYSYELYFQAASGEAPLSAPNLSSSGILSAGGVGLPNIGYAPFTRPTFALPPANVASLRLIHASCRKAHGPGRDALQTLHGMIGASVQSAAQRPHQLFLTGDQIYADDVADALLAMLIDAGEALGFFSEGVPGGDPPLPGQRADHVRAAGITADAEVARSHLVRFSEFCSMYLFAWSDVLWQGNDFPTFEEATGRPLPTEEDEDALEEAQGIYTEQLAPLRQFRGTLADVRRALANVPCYMIFDDHEVTDDWFLDRGWVNRSFNEPLLNRIVQNGLASYAIFQGWGNDPTEFERARDGVLLVDRLADWAQGPFVPTGEALQQALGLPRAEVPGNAESFTRHASAMRWHYALDWGSYQVLVLDQRTRRGYAPGGPHNHPAVIASSAGANDPLDVQLSALNPLDAEQLVLIIAPGPVAGIAPIEALQLLDASPYPSDTEFWNVRPIALERLLAGLAIRPAAASNVRRARFVFLSGDVHYGFAGRLRYRAGSVLDGTGATETVFAQFTSSSLKNQSDLTVRLHDNPRSITRVLSEVSRYGWKNPGGGPLTVGTLSVQPPLGPPVASPVRLRGNTIIYEEPHPLSLPPGTTFERAFPGPTRQPDWIYRFDLLVSTDEREERENVPEITPVPFPPPGDRTAELQAHLRSLGGAEAYGRYWSSGKGIVGQNNVGELTFHWGPDDDKFARQELWWWLAASPTPFPHSRMDCELSLDPAEGL